MTCLSDHARIACNPPEPSNMTETTNVSLTPAQIRFLLDMMMGCPLGATTQYSYHHGVDDGELYDQLLNCLPNSHSTP